MRLSKKFLTEILAFLMVFSIVGFTSYDVASANVDKPKKQDNGEVSAEKDSSITIQKINGSVAKINLSESIKVSINKEGLATLKDTVTNKTETLPRTTTDKYDQPVNLYYEKHNGDLLVYAESQFQVFGMGNCIAGIAGGAVSGGTTGGLGGAAVGTVTLPGIGTVSAGLVGAVGGAVGGGLTGGATFC